MLHMCVCMSSHFVGNHPIWILEHGPLISKMVLSPPPPLGQHVLPRVWYGMTCLLVRIASRSGPCSVVWERVHGVLINHTEQEGPMWGNLSIARGASVGKP
jgi:hypothetical protein